MHVVLWDTRKIPVVKELAGGFGAGPPAAPPGLGRCFFPRYFSWKRWPAALTLGHLAAILQRLGHRVEYAVDRFPPADLYVFHPALITLAEERRAMIDVRRRLPDCPVLVIGPAASAMPDLFADLPVTILRGEPEQLLWRFDEVLAVGNALRGVPRMTETMLDSPGTGRSPFPIGPTFDSRLSTLDLPPSNLIPLGHVEDLDRLPPPDWSPFHPRSFRVGHDFWRFPTALIQASRGCTFACGHCPYLVGRRGIRVRDPASVVEEMRYGIRRWGFRSFKFRDPLFGQDAAQARRLAEGIARLPRKIQFSVETRAELLPDDLLVELKRAGLAAVTLGIETPEPRPSVSCRRSDDAIQRQEALIASCRRLGIRTAASFVIGFPEDDEFSIRHAARYARQLNPTFANFNLLTPYPGTEYFSRCASEIADFDFSHYTSYRPVMRTPLVPAGDLKRLHARCLAHFYNRWAYLRSNAPLLFPVWRRLAPH
jgi:anaerobic magnesium-protoporphyrin IX monomethyl ester cyclase